MFKSGGRLVLISARDEAKEAILTKFSNRLQTLSPAKSQGSEKY